jgi:AraC-like DNA-binding protein
MESVVIKPKSVVLKRYIDYFLFFKKDDNKLIRYATFPNNNLCLAIYNNNDIDYTSEVASNFCAINPGRNQFKSRLFGFHKMPFQVEINGALDQICILFHPAALSAFTPLPYEDLINTDQVFDLLFGDRKHFILEALFEEEVLSCRAEKLEALLLEKLNDRLPSKLMEAFDLIAHSRDDLSINLLAKKLAVSTPTLFRIFKSNVGMNPKTYIKTVRFRNVLNNILNTENPLMSIAHANNYFDQAHFINDFKSFTGYSPNRLLKKVSVTQQNLAWIYSER